MKSLIIIFWIPDEFTNIVITQLDHGAVGYFHNCDLLRSVSLHQFANPALLTTFKYTYCSARLFRNHGLHLRCGNVLQKCRTPTIGAKDESIVTYDVFDDKLQIINNKILVKLFRFMKIKIKLYDLAQLQSLGEFTYLLIICLMLTFFS